MHLIIEQLQYQVGEIIHKISLTTDQDEIEYLSLARESVLEAINYLESIQIKN